MFQRRPMKIIWMFLFIFNITVYNVSASDGLLEFRLAQENEKANTEIIMGRNGTKLYVDKIPFLTLSEISEVNLKVDKSPPPLWLKLAVEATGSKIEGPQVEIEIVLNDSGREINSKVTSENAGKKVAIFLQGKLVLEPVIHGKIDTKSIMITTGYEEDEARDLVAEINKKIKRN